MYRLMFCRKKHRKEIIELIKLIIYREVGGEGTEVMEVWKQTGRVGENITLTQIYFSV